MPGKKDCILVVKDGHRVLEQKYLVLCNLKEAFQRYKGKFPEKKIGFSNCILATKRVCACGCQWNPFCQCVHNPSECETDDSWFQTWASYRRAYFVFEWV